MNRRSFLASSGALLAGVSLARPSLAAAATPTPARQGIATGPLHPPALAPRFGDGRDWWFERRFGLFLHWGLYSLEAWHEQDQWRRHIPRATYARLQQHWNPVRFDPEAWLDAAQQAGMKYLCLTTKHHDGFCLWDTKQTSFNVMNTPYGRDLVGLLAEACHRRRFPLCLYYSIVDWHHPNYPNRGRHHELPPQPGDTEDWEQYLRFLREQVRELCTNYGEIHGFWWDMNVPEHKDPSVNAMIRQLQPKAVINNRGFDEGDFGTPERDYTKEGETLLSLEKRTEACQSIGMESWGWRADEDYYSDHYLQRSLSRYLARDGNYLLNVGPLPDGSLPPQALAILRRLGSWYHQVREAFEETVPASHLTSNRDLLLTRRDNCLYVILHSEVKGEAVKLKPIASLPRRATLLNTGASLRCSIDLVPSEHAVGQGSLRLVGLPVNNLSGEVLVAKLEFDAPPRLLQAASAASRLAE